MGPYSCWKMPHVGKKHWAGGMRLLLLGTASVGFPSGQCACCKPRRNELLAAYVVYNTLKVKDRLPLSMRKHFSRKSYVQIPLMKGHSDIRLAELSPPRGPQFATWEEGPKMLPYIYSSMSLYLNRTHATIAVLRQNACGAWALGRNLNKNLKLNLVNSSWKITWNRELLLLFLEFCCWAWKPWELIDQCQTLAELTAHMDNFLVTDRIQPLLWYLSYILQGLSNN